MSKVLIEELKKTPVEYLVDLNPETTVTPDELIESLGSSVSANPEVKETDYLAGGHEQQQQDDTEDIDHEDLEDEDPEIDDDNEDPEIDNDTDTGNEKEINADEPTHIKFENFLTPEMCVGLLDNVSAAGKKAIFSIYDIKVKKSDLHYSAKQKKLLEEPLEKAFKKTGFNVKNPWAAFLISWAGIEATHIADIIATDKIEKKHAAALKEKDNQVAQLQYELWQMQQRMATMQQNNPVHHQAPAQEQPADPTGGRDEHGRFKSTGKRKKGALTRKPGETRGRKPKGEVIQFPPQQTGTV